MAPKIKGTKPGATRSAGPGGLSAAEFANWYRHEAVRQWETLDLKSIAALARLIEEAQAAGKNVFTVGNGGSASTASHWACDLLKTAAKPGAKPVRCISLSDSMALVTACGNDLSFDDVFSRQLEGLVSAGDLVIFLSGSGNSPNLLKAAKLAKARGAKTAALLGFDGGKLKGAVDAAVHVACDQYGVIEDLHMGVGHILTFYLKQKRRS
jgi:D-sedoheptulose 7-phosphate isomerase